MMVRAGRSHPLAIAAIPRFLCLLAITGLVACTEYGIPIEIKLWDSKQTPLAHMVDVTNEFGIKVLAEHNFLNDNNIAFSPYGLMGILVALYEGVDGESSYQIQRSMQLPWNRNVMRIGFRDIHRTLKTYFVPEEGFLAGLALNNENVTFNESYKKILRFYGFDLESDQPPSTKPNNTTETPQITTTSPVTSSTTTTTPSVSTSSMSSSTPTTIITISEKTTTRVDTSSNPSTKVTREETSPNPKTESLDSVDIREEHADNPVLTTSAISTLSSTSIETTTVKGDTTQMTIVSSSAITEPLIIPFTTGTPFSTDVSTTQLTQMMSQESTETTTMASSSNVDEMTSTIPTTFNTEALSTDSSVMTTNTQMSSSSITETQQTEQMSKSTESSTMPTTSTLETLERRKKSVLDFLYTSPPYDDDYLVYRSFGVGPEPPLENKEQDDTMFMANGLRNIQVAYMHYDSVMEYAYLPHLEASAIRLPLDSERYYLLVILPARRGSGELDRLLARMARESDLSDVYAALHPRRVRAVVPSFIVKGHVTLTTDLQKVGIRDVFEPRQHDFTPMTPQTGVYVRSIEQAVSVAIRKYQPDVKHRYTSNRAPVILSATYPFLYFVMDTNIHVALMAGKMVDPLNSRIL